tara:strand:+ start:133 stop:348 length:216 start_codon:yes stop_codon:yes gene_type:complete
MTKNQAIQEAHHWRERAEAAEKSLDVLQAALVEAAVPLEVLHAIDCDLAPETQQAIGRAVAAIREVLKVGK